MIIMGVASNKTAYMMSCLFDRCLGIMKILFLQKLCIYETLVLLILYQLLPINYFVVTLERSSPSLSSNIKQID